MLGVHCKTLVEEQLWDDMAMEIPANGTPRVSLCAPTPLLTWIPRGPAWGPVRAVLE